MGSTQRQGEEEVKEEEEELQASVCVKREKSLLKPKILPRIRLEVSV